MTPLPATRRLRWLPVLVGGTAIVALAAWIIHRPHKPLALRIPGADASPAADNQPKGNPVLSGKVIAGTGIPADQPGSWPQFRGVHRDGKSDATNLATAWPQEGPKRLWAVEVGEGYAGPAVRNGRVYLMDYDRGSGSDALRCLSLQDGVEIWRYAYPISIKRNHGMSRTVPAVASSRVVAIGPKCQVICCDAATGELRWSLDLVQQFGATVPEWYTGQCPLIDGDHVILAPGGPEALLMAVQLTDGSVIWRTPNPDDWKMTHSSIMPAECAGQPQYIYCANKGVVGVSAKDGTLLWRTSDWKISIATVPSPCVIDASRVFLTGGYNAGSIMLELKAGEEGIQPETLYRLNAEAFGATQQSPVVFENHLYGIRADGRLVCLSLDGKVEWDSGPTETFGLGPLLLADGLIYAMDGSGLLRLVKATSARYEPLAQAQVLQGHESWGPMALAGTRLLVRDFTQLACLEVGER